MISTAKDLTDVENEVQDYLVQGINKLNFMNLSSLNLKVLACLKDPLSVNTASMLESMLKELKLRNQDTAAKSGRKKKIAEKENIDHNSTPQSVNTTPNTTNTSNSASKDDLDSTESGRPRRKAYTNATEKVNHQINMSLKGKMRNQDAIKIKTEPISEEAPAYVADIKQELADMPPPAAVPKRAGRKKKEDSVKVERASTRRPRTQNSTILPPEAISEDESASGGKRSDVVLIQESVPTISLDSNDEREDPNEEEDVVPESEPEITPAPKEALKAGRGRPKKEAAKRTRSPSVESKRTIGRPKRTKRKVSTPAKAVETSLYEDAVNAPEARNSVQPAAEIFNTPPTQNVSLGDEEIVVQLPTVFLNRLSKDVLVEAAKNPNATITISKTAVMNETIVIQKANPNATVVIENKPQVLNSTVTLSKQTRQPPLPDVDDIMTDDESETEGKLQVAPTKKVGKQLFNPFENSPVKKKVEAFEKLGAKTATEATTTRVTRTKTRQKAKAVDADQKEVQKPEDVSDDSPTYGKTKIPGYTTPVTSNRYLPTLSSSTGKSNLSNSAQKTLSAIKLSSQHFRDYEQVRKEKEAEAQKKKDAYLLKQTEDKRRRREEKEQKAKQQRAVLEEEKKRALEQQKAREEKHKLLLQEKQDRINKQREEAERRRIIAKQKHEEMKREEERKRAEDLRLLKKREEEEKRKVEEEKRLQALKIRQMQKEADTAEKQLQSVQQPLYMTQKAPLLPTPDCYDSDDENAPKKPQLPAWNAKEAMHQRMRAMSYIDAKLRNTFFCVKAQTPNLQELLPNVDPRKLRRNSSAIWKQAPRFTMMPQLNEDF